jgi:hypothetical protein
METGVLELILQNIDTNAAIAGIGDGLRGSVTPGFLYGALFTNDPGEVGSTANEATYTGYARVAVVRSAVGWTVAGNIGDNAGPITFPQATGGSETLTHFALMTAVTGGQMIFYGALNASLIISSGVTPEFGTGDLDITAD